MGGGSGDRKAEFLMIGVLVLIIGASLAFTIWNLVGGRSASPTEKVEYKFECVRCGHSFTPDLTEKDRFEIGEEATALDCPDPDCKAKESCYPMIRCPKCEHYYLSEETKYMVTVKDPPKDRKPLKDICPNCGTDRAEYLKEKYRKQK